MTNLSAFIAQAHKHGYAAAQPDNATEQAGTILTYERGPWRYRDSYTGSSAFVGHEVVSRESDPVWGMSYYGDLTTVTVDRDKVYEFLRDALREATPARPYRGPEQLRGDDLSYRSTVDGNLDRFDGEEEIRTDGAVVYRGQFSGGRVE
jgi:hypothetical protein